MLVFNTLNHVVITATVLSKGTHQKGTLILSKGTHQKGTLVLSKGTYYQKELIKKEHSYYQKELIKKELINRNTHINISGLEETLLKGNLYHRNPHASNMDFHNGSVKRQGGSGFLVSPTESSSRHLQGTYLWSLDRPIRSHTFSFPHRKFLWSRDRSRSEESLKRCDRIDVKNGQRLPTQQRENISGCSPV